METHNVRNENKIYKKFPRNLPVFDLLFKTFLNIPSCEVMPNLDEFINKIKELLEYELKTSFYKDKQYLIDLQRKYQPEKYQ